MKAKKILSGILTAMLLISSAAFSAAAYEWEDAGSRYNREQDFKIWEQTQFTDIASEKAEFAQTDKEESVQPIDLNAQNVTVNYNYSQKLNVRVTNDSGSYLVENGGTVSAGSSLWIGMYIENYIDHKVLINGQEVKLTANGDEYWYNTNYTANSDVNIQVVPEIWSDARMSEYVTLNADPNAEVWFYNSYYGRITGSVYDGNHIRKGDLICVRVNSEPYDSMPEIYINGVYTESKLNDDGYWQIWGYKVPDNSDTLDIKIGGEKVNINYDIYDSRVYVYFNDYYINNGSKLAKGSSLSIGMDINDYIDNKVLVNGKELVLEENGDEYRYFANYTADSDVTIEVVPEKWSSSRMSEYVTLNADRNAEVWFYNSYYKNITRSIQNGDYIRKGDMICIKVCYRPYEGMPEIYINGVYTESKLNDDGYWQIWGYKVPDNSDTLDIRINGEKVNVTYNDSHVQAYFEGEGDTYINNGDKLAKGTLMSIGMSLNDYINNKVLVNGKELVLERKSSEYWYSANYTADSDVTIDVVPEKWSDEKMANYAVLDLDENIWAFFFNSDAGYITNYLPNGGYAEKGDYLSFECWNETGANTKPEIYINGVLADCRSNNGYWSIEGYRIPDNADKVTVRIGNSANKAQISEFVDRLYSIILDRHAEQAGLDDWTNSLITGEKTSADIVYGLANSPEFNNKGLSNDQIVERMYLAMLGRASDEGGKADWLDAMANGCTVNGIINGFSGSQEFANICAGYGISAGSITSCEPRDKNVNLTAFVSRMYTKALGRAYDVDGLNGWTGDYLDGKATANKIAYGFILSDEFVNRNLSDEAYVDTLYRTFFDREPDEGGKAGWLAELANGASRQDVLDGFLGAEEFANLKAGFGV